MIHSVYYIPTPNMQWLWEKRMMCESQKKINKFWIRFLFRFKILNLCTIYDTCNGWWLSNTINLSLLRAFTRKIRLPLARLADPFSSSLRCFRIYIFFCSHSIFCIDKMIYWNVTLLSHKFQFNPIWKG